MPHLEVAFPDADGVHQLVRVHPVVTPPWVYGHLAQQRCFLMVTWPNRDASLRSSDQTEVRRHETLVWVT